MFARSMDGGRTWARLKFQVGSDGPSVQLTPHFNALQPGNPVALYASFRMRNGIYVSRDGGDSWSFVTDRVNNDNAIGVSPADSNFLMGPARKGWSSRRMADGLGRRSARRICLTFALI